MTPGELGEIDRRILGIGLDLLERQRREDGLPRSPRIDTIRAKLEDTTGQSRDGTADVSHGPMRCPPPAALLDLDEVARLLKLSRKSVDRRVAAGRLATIKIGRLRRCHPDELARFQRDNPS